MDRSFALPSPMVAKFIEDNLKVEYTGTTEVGVVCPFHEDTKASMSINRLNGLWQCYGCGENGNLYTLRHRLKYRFETLPRRPKAKNPSRSGRRQLPEDPCPYPVVRRPTS